MYGNLGNGITGISKGKDLTRRTQKVHRVHREEKTRSLKTAGPSAPVKRAGHKKRASLRTKLRHPERAVIEAVSHPGRLVRCCPSRVRSSLPTFDPGGG